MAIQLHPGRLRAGVWEAVLIAGEDPPRVEALHDGTVLPGLTLAALAGRPGEWLLRLPLPVDRLDDGVQTILVRAVGTDRPLGAFSILAGAPLEADLRAEIDLLRAELDLLQRAFRRHAAGDPPAAP